LYREVKRAISWKLKAKKKRAGSKREDRAKQLSS